MRTVFFDVDTQLDFLSPAGALYVPGSEQIASNLTLLANFAAQHGTPVISTLDTHLEDDPEFKLWKPHCVAGTQGHQKYSGSLLPRNSEQQILFEKHRIEFFNDPQLEGVLDRLAADRFVVYGLVTEYCVRNSIFSLLARQARVELVTDAIHALDEKAGREVLSRFASNGGHLTTTAAVS